MAEGVGPQPASAEPHSEGQAREPQGHGREHLSRQQPQVGGDPDVILVQELWATKLQVEQAAKEIDYAAAVGPGEQCLAAVLFKPGMGQQLHLPFEGEWARRTAAVTISLGGGYGCCVASVSRGPRRHSGGELGQTLAAILGEFRSRGRGPGVVGGDLNVEREDNAASELFARAGWEVVLRR